MLVEQLNMVFSTPKIPQQAWMDTMMLVGLETQKIKRAPVEVALSFETIMCHGSAENITTYHSPQLR